MLENAEIVSLFPELGVERVKLAFHDMCHNFYQLPSCFFDMFCSKRIHSKSDIIL